MTLSAQNTALAYLGADLRPPQPEPAIGPEALTARMAIEARNLREAVAETRQGRLATILFLEAFTRNIDLTQFDREVL